MGTLASRFALAVVLSLQRLVGMPQVIGPLGERAVSARASVQTHLVLVYCTRGRPLLGPWSRGGTVQLGDGS